MSATTVWIPETLKIQKDHPYHDQMLKVINHLLVKRYARKKEQRDDPIPLGKELLRSLAGGSGGGHGAKVREELERIGFLSIVRNDNGQKSYRTKHYTIRVIIHKEHAEASLVPKALHRKPRTKATHTASTKTTEVEQYLLDNLKRISSSHIQLKELIHEGMSDGAIKSRIHALNMLNLGLHFGNRQNAGRRFFSSITSVHKPIRRKCKMDGQNLVEIDVKSCQPLLLTRLISDHTEGNKQYQHKKELNEIKLLCYEGNFYREFEYLRWCEGLGIDDRGLLKQDFCHAFFNYSTGFVKHPFSMGFLERFPHSWLAVYEIKKKYERDFHMPANKRHSQLARRLQRMESQCMIDDLVGGIIRDGLSIPILTVHDAILTTPPHVEHIKQRIKNSFLQRYGLVVGLGIKGGDSSLAA